jgi:hypothetical protein
MGVWYQFFLLKSRTILRDPLRIVTTPAVAAVRINHPNQTFIAVPYCLSRPQLA